MTVLASSAAASVMPMSMTSPYGVTGINMIKQLEAQGEVRIQAQPERF
jgi:hypothetical protein